MNNLNHEFRIKSPPGIPIVAASQILTGADVYHGGGYIGEKYKPFQVVSFNGSDGCDESCLRVMCQRRDEIYLTQVLPGFIAEQYRLQRGLRVLPI